MLFVDLNYQYKCIRKDVLDHIEKVLDSGHYILDAEKETIQKIASVIRGVVKG